MDNPNYEEAQQWLIKSQRDLKVAWVLFKNEAEEALRIASLILNFVTKLLPENQ